MAMGIRQPIFRVKPLSPPATIAALVLSLGVCALGLLGWKSWEAREATLAHSADNSQNLAHSLAQHASRTFETVGIVLAGIIERVQNDGVGPQQRVRMDDLLASWAPALPQVREIGILDAGGVWLFSSLPSLPTHSNGDREYFVFHRDHPDLGLRINQPLRSRLTGRWTLLLTRRINHADGSFAGVATAAIDLDYFQRFYESFEIGRQGTIGLFRDDGVLLVRRPFVEDNVGRSFIHMPLFRAFVGAAPSGYFRVVSPFDGIDKHIAYVRLADYPVVITVALAEKEMLAAWRSSFRTDILVAAVVWLVIALMGGLIVLQLRLRGRAEAMLRDSEERYRLLADNAGDVVIRLGLDGVRRYVSPSIRDVLGWLPDEIVGTCAFHLAHPGHREDMERLVEQMADGLAHARLSYQCRRKDGAYVWVETSFRLVRDAIGAPSEIIAVLRDVSQRKAAEEELQEANAHLKALAATDPLTGIPNRRSFDNALDRERRRALRTNQPLSMLFIDIDRFKSYNDSYGHPAGDACLRAVAQAVMKILRRPGDLPARYGGEEFAVILPETDESGAMTIAEELRAAINNLAIMHRGSPLGFVTISIGAATASTGDDDGGLIRAADQALYQAKRAGRNQVANSSAIVEAEAKVA